LDDLPDGSQKIVILAYLVNLCSLNVMVSALFSEQVIPPK